MIIPDWLDVSDEVRSAVRAGGPVVALESTLIAHGLPPPINLETAIEAEQAVRAEGAIPATVAVWNGRPLIGLGGEQIVELARRADVLKASRRDLAQAIAQGRTAATTVAATMFLAHAAGVRIFATGGIGGAHRGAEQSFDISADLMELARTPMLVVCAGAKSILDLPRTLEILETLGIPVAGYRTANFPAFFVRDSGLPLSIRVESPGEAAALFKTHARLTGTGVLLAQPVTQEAAIPADEFERALRQAEADAAQRKVLGPQLTPFLLARIAQLTDGRSIRANRELIVANARLAAQSARALSALLENRGPA
jgi:pseudouridine-5'-phosphate glycosidase